MIDGVNFPVIKDFDRTFEFADLKEVPDIKELPDSIEEMSRQVIEKPNIPYIEQTSRAALREMVTKSLLENSTNEITFGSASKQELESKLKDAKRRFEDHAKNYEMMSKENAEGIVYNAKCLIADRKAGMESAKREIEELTKQIENDKD